ncbi:MAG: SDR family NAD(P)-dependent oxidoreductase [Cyclobacteriaceae bacterium]
MDKQILITGVSTGLGHQLASDFIKKGYKVYGSVRKSEDAVALIKSFGRSFHPLTFDVTDHKAIDDAAFELGEILNGKPLAGLINNAGIAIAGPLLHVPIEQFKHQMDVNVIGLVKVTQAFAPLLGANVDYLHPPGRIIQIGSVSGKIAMPFVGPYAASKYALEAISTSLRRELIGYGIDVILIGSGAIKTPIWNKSTSEVASAYSNTPYGNILASFNRKFVQSAIHTALSTEFVSENIVRIFESKHPKTRYTFIQKRLTNWILPRLLPDRFLDRFLAKTTGLIKIKEQNFSKNP